MEQQNLQTSVFMEQSTDELKRQNTLSKQLTINSNTQTNLINKYYKNFTSEQIALYFSYFNNYSSTYQQLKKQYKYIQNMSTGQKRYLLNYSLTHIVKGNQIAIQISELKHEIQKINENANKIIIIDETDSIKEQENLNKMTENTIHLDNKPLNIVLIVIHGKVQFNQKTYQPGQQISILQSSEISSLRGQFSVCILIDKNKFESQIINFNAFHFKKKCLQDLLLSKLDFNISYRKIYQLVGYIKVVERTQQHNFILNSKNNISFKGIYLLVKGEFEIYKYQNGRKIRVGQISSGYFGEQSLWGQFQYLLYMKSRQAEILHISRQSFQQIIHSQQWTIFNQSLRRLYKIKDQIRTKQFNIIIKIRHRNEEQNKRIKTVKKMNSQKNQNEEKLNLMLTFKPQWLIEKEKKENQKLNKRKNLFDSEKVQIIKQKRRKYFSVKQNNEQGCKFQKQVMKKYLAYQQQQTCQPIISQVNILNFNKTIQFSKFSKTSLLSPMRKTHQKSSFTFSPKNVKQKSQQKYDRTPKRKEYKNKWDPAYSKYYDRVLADSVKKQKHLSLILRLKSKLFPEKRGEMFTFSDAIETKQMSFYQIQKKRRQQSEQKNKRAFQKIFKTKLLTSTPTTRYPATFR